VCVYAGDLAILSASSSPNTINTYKIEHCYTLLLPVSSAIRAQIRYQKGEKMDVYDRPQRRMLCSCIHIGTSTIDQ
jgi:hypothetical protein